MELYFLNSNIFFSSFCALRWNRRSTCEAEVKFNPPAMSISYVWMQCLTIAYNYRIQGTVRPECSILLICRIFVSALLLLLDCHFEIGCEDILFSQIHNDFWQLFFMTFWVIHFVNKKMMPRFRLFFRCLLCN